VNSQTPHASKNKRHKTYFLTHVVTVALSYSKLFGREATPAPGPQDDNKNTYQVSILCSLNFEVFQKRTFFRIKHFRPPSPKRPVAEMSCRRTVTDR